jgi:hypothetical protein
MPGHYARLRDGARPVASGSGMDVEVTVAPATAPPDTVQSGALNGLSGSFGNIGRLKNSYQFWTTEYICTNGRPAGPAAAFWQRIKTIALERTVSSPETRQNLG